VSDRLDPPLDEADHVRGPAGAPLELVMYGDFECPYCAAAQSIVARVLDRTDGRVRFAFRHLPIDELHPQARLAAEASEAADAQDGFWAYHDALYANRGRLAAADLVDVARRQGLDGERLADELADHRWAPRVSRDTESARASGVAGTPTFFANGVRHDGSFDAGSLIEALESGHPGP
jgi:NhaA family Na+:H+ antiporter